MTSNPIKNPYSFHPYIADAYSAVHDWLATQEDANGYKDVRYPRRGTSEMDDLLNEPTLKMAAAQYNIYFPTHYFKVIYILENIITPARLLNWIEQNQYLCLIDIGCGAGAASAAFLQTIISTIETFNFKLTHPLHICCVGIDVNLFTLPIYNKLMHEIKSRIIIQNVDLKFNVCPGGIIEKIGKISNYLIQKRDRWNQPCISNLFMIQSNVIDMLEKEHNKRKQEAAQLIKYEINHAAILGDEQWFADDYASVYKLLFEEIPVDLLHTITIGTNNDNYRVNKMGNAISQIFGSSRHQFESLVRGTYNLTFKNPDNCYWKDNNRGRNKPDPKISFHIDVSKITSVKLEEDQDWHDVTNLKNLEAAWVCARNHLLDESLCDEVEIRLFENNLHQNLYRLQSLLVAYVEEVDREDDYIAYDFPKNSSEVRRRGLSRMEGEILSVAIVKILGRKVANRRENSYAYRMKNEYGNRPTEKLYEHWFLGYKNFIESSLSAAKQYPNGIVLRADIKSFYTKIIQDKLNELVSQELSESQRVRWLLRLLLCKKINEHELGLGITQGHIGSGFYANIYLTSIDIKFDCGNEWGVKFFRYLDDIIFVIPDPEDENEVREQLDKELKELGLELNKDKTERFDSVSKFLESYSEDEDLTKLGNDFQKIVNALWVMDSGCRVHFQIASRKGNDRLWWGLVDRYQDCLQATGIYIKATELSRRINFYLFNWKKRQKDLKGEPELILPNLLDENRGIKQWTSAFEKANSNWKKDKDSLKAELIGMFCESWQKLKTLETNDVRKTRKLEKRLRFALNKLYLLGVAEISNSLEEILCQCPWLVREPLQAVEGLARQEHLSAVVGILAYYQNTSYPMSEYMRAVTLRAIRFLPTIDANIWKNIVEFGTTGSLVERLMATETWLACGYMSARFVQQDHINAVVSALHGEPPPTKRLKKNYLLILGLYDVDLLSNEPRNSQDYLLSEARNIALEGSAGDLFNYHEPQVIREKYYSGKHQPEIGEDRYY